MVGSDPRGEKLVVDYQSLHEEHNTVDGSKRTQTLIVKCLDFLAKDVDAFQQESNITVKEGSIF